MKEQPIFVIEKGRVAFTFTAALAGQRKPQEWVIYPVKGNAKTVVIQCDTMIAQFSLEDGVGVISKPRSGGAYFMHLDRYLFGAKDFVAPKALVDAINESPVVGEHAVINAQGAQYGGERII